MEPIDIFGWIIKWMWGFPYTLSKKYHAPKLIRVLAILINIPLIVVMMGITIPFLFILMIVQVIYDC